MYIGSSNRRAASPHPSLDGDEAIPIQFYKCVAHQIASFSSCNANVIYSVCKMGSSSFCSVVNVMKIGWRLLAINRKSSPNVFAMRMHETSDLGCKFKGGLSGMVVQAVLSLFATMIWRLWPYQFSHSRRPPKQSRLPWSLGRLKIINGNSYVFALTLIIDRSLSHL